MRKIVVLLFFGLSSVAWAQPSVQLAITLNELENLTLKSKLLCSGKIDYQIEDTRKNGNNGIPDTVFENCLAQHNEQSILITSWAGVGIYNAPGRQGKNEDQKSYLVVLQAGDQVYSNWSVTYSLVEADQKMFWDIPAPDKFKIRPTMRQWMRLTAEFIEETP